MNLGIKEKIEKAKAEGIKEEPQRPQSINFVIKELLRRKNLSDVWETTPEEISAYIASNDVKQWVKDNGYEEEYINLEISLRDYNDFLEFEKDKKDYALKILYKALKQGKSLNLRLRNWECPDDVTELVIV